MEKEASPLITGLDSLLLRLIDRVEKLRLEIVKTFKSTDNKLDAIQKKMEEIEEEEDWSTDEEDIPLDKTVELKKQKIQENKEI